MIGIADTVESWGLQLPRTRRDARPLRARDAVLYGPDPWLYGVMRVKLSRADGLLTVRLPDGTTELFRAAELRALEPEATPGSEPRVRMLAA